MVKRPNAPVHRAAANDIDFKSRAARGSVCSAGGPSGDSDRDRDREATSGRLVSPQLLKQPAGTTSPRQTKTLTGATATSHTVVHSTRDRLSNRLRMVQHLVAARPGRMKTTAGPPLDRFHRRRLAGDEFQNAHETSEDEQNTDHEIHQSKDA